MKCLKRRTTQQTTQPAGYVALITVVLVMLTVVVVGVMVTLIGANGLLTGFVHSQGAQTYYVADSCAYEALLRLKREGLAYVGSHTLTLGDDDCTIEVTNTSGTLVDVVISANHDSTTYRTVDLTVDTADLTVALWQEAD